MPSPLISPGLIRRLRTVANRGLQTRITLIRRLEPEENPYGAGVETYEDTGTEMWAWVREMGTAAIKDFQSRAGEVGDYRIHMEATVIAIAGDRIRMDGEMYEVQDSNMQNTYRVFTTVIAKRIQP